MAQTVLVSMRLRGDDLGPYKALNDAARAALPAEHDGWEADCPGDSGDPEFTLHFYGADASDMWARLSPVLAGSPLLAGGEVTLRFGSALDPADGY